MPIYCYRCPICRTRSERFLHSASAGGGDGCTCQACGRPVERDFAAESGCGRDACCGEIRSFAAGVMPEQIPQVQRRLAALGVEGVRFDPRSGDALFADRRSRLRALRAMGLHDRNEIRG